MKKIILTIILFVAVGYSQNTGFYDPSTGQYRALIQDSLSWSLTFNPFNGELSVTNYKGQTVLRSNIPSVGINWQPTIDSLRTLIDSLLVDVQDLEAAVVLIQQTLQQGTVQLPTPALAGYTTTDAKNILIYSFPTSPAVDSIQISYRKVTIGDPNFTILDTINTDSSQYTHSTLAANSTYEYYIRYIHVGELSPLSNTLSLTTADTNTIALPSAPTNLVASTPASAGTINLTWACADTTVNEWFQIDTSATQGGAYSQKALVAGNVLSYSHTGLGNNVTVWYRVSAWNKEPADSVQSAYSNLASGTTQNPTEVWDLTYYVNSSTGNDNFNGTSTSTPFATYSKAITTYNGVSTGQRVRVLFASGQTFTGQATITRSGQASQHSFFGVYGGADTVIISGNNVFNNHVLRINSNIQYLTFRMLKFMGLNYNVSANLPGTVLLQQRANNITFKNCTFTTSTENTGNIWAGIITMIDPHTITFDSCGVYGTMYGILTLTNFNNSHNDVYDMTYTNSYFHDLDPRNAGATNPLRGRAIVHYTWWGSLGPDVVGDQSTPGSVFGQEGTIRDVRIDSCTFERIISNCIDWYWHHNFTTAGVKGYNWTVTNNIANDIAFNFIDLAPIGHRGGAADKSTVSFNTINKAGWDWTTGQVFSIPDEGFVNVIQTHNWDNVIIDGNIIDSVFQTQGDGNGIIMDYTLSASTYKCDSIIVRNNVISYALRSSDDNFAETSAAGIQLAFSRDCDVYNNVVYGSNIGIGVTNRTEGAFIYNNTLDDNFEAAVYTGGDANTTVKNNSLTNSGSGIRTGGTTTGLVTTHNLFFGNTGGTVGTNNVTSDPLYTNEGTRDYHLQAGSPAINAGTAITSPVGVNRTTDYDGDAISGNPDIGADERP